MTRRVNWWPYIYFLHAAILASICFLCQGLDGLVARLNVVISVSFGNLCQRYSASFSIIIVAFAFTETEFLYNAVFGLAHTNT